MKFTDWVTHVEDLGGTPATWPFADAHQGEPAANFLVPLYVSLYNQGLLPSTGTQAANSNKSVFVLGSAMAGGPLTGVPPTNTTVQSIEQAVFVAADKTADAIGLPSLASIEDSLTSTGKYALWIAGGLLAVYLLGRTHVPGNNSLERDRD